jgi:chromosomal replication initiation ATPase DnaA
MAVQLTLPFEQKPRYRREEFIAAPCNRDALAFLDAWPRWPAPAAVLCGPAGSGKTHLAHVWANRAGAGMVEAVDLGENAVPAGPLVVENAGISLPGTAEQMLFALIERGSPLLITSREPPESWPAEIPDLASRFRALLAFSLWAPDEALLVALTKKLFFSRQLIVPDAVAAEMVKALERSPAAVLAFVEQADREALARKCPVSVALVRELLSNFR